MGSAGFDQQLSQIGAGSLIMLDGFSEQKQGKILEALENSESAEWIVVTSDTSCKSQQASRLAQIGE